MRESKEILAWCYQTYGNHELSLGWNASRVNTQFYLLNEKDLEMFILKWG